MSDYQRRELDNSLSDYEYYVLRRYVAHTTTTLQRYKFTFSGL